MAGTMADNVIDANRAGPVGTAPRASPWHAAGSDTWAVQPACAAASPVAAAASPEARDEAPAV